ncbi:hypothetical protein Tco_1429751 [Tanacetum coccineum]
MNQNLSNSNSSSFDQFQPPQYPVIHHSPQETSEEVLQAREDLMKAIQTFLRKFSRIPFGEIPKVLLIAWERFFEIKHAFTDKQYQQEDIQELMGKLLEDISKREITPSIPLVLENPSSSPIPVVDSDFLIEEVDTFLIPEDSIPSDPIPEYERFTFDIEPDALVINNFDELNEDECFDPGGGEIDVSQNIKDDDSFTFVIRTFLPYRTYPVDSPLLLSTKSEDTIFDPRHFHLEPVASHQDGTFMCFNVYPNINESPIEIFSSICFPYGQLNARIESSYVTRLPKTKLFVGGTPCLSFYLRSYF